MNGRIIKLRGDIRGDEPRASVLRELLDVLVDATRQSIRLRVEGRSRAGGTDPQWLIDAAEFRLVELRKGSMELEYTAEPLHRAAPDRFVQRSFEFMPIDHDKTGVDLLQETLHDILRADRDSDLYDEKLLETLGKGWKRVFSLGIDTVEFGGKAPLTFSAEDIETFKVLKRSIPKPEMARVAGVLDTVTASSRSFVLRIADGGALRGTFDEAQFDQIKAALNESVVISGQVEFKPSGSARRIIATSVEPVESPEDESVWQALPISTYKPLSRSEYVRPAQDPGQENGLAALVGRLRGDETEEEFQEAIKELS